jgi:hypothetical protein
MHRTNVVRMRRRLCSPLLEQAKQKAREHEARGPFTGLGDRSRSRLATMIFIRQNALAMPKTMALLQSEEPPQSVSLSEVSLYISDRFTPEKGTVSDTL